jgi:hypothetical protein
MDIYLKDIKLAVNDLLVICDNGGSITIQCDKYAHTYDDAADVAYDLCLIFSGHDTSAWDGNNDHDRIASVYDDGYSVYTQRDLHDLALVDPTDFDGSENWANENALHRELYKIYHS